MRRASEIQRQKNVVELREEMAQQSILHCQEEYLRSIQAIQEDLLRAKEDLKLMTLNEEEHKSEFETLENRIQEFQSENRLLRAQISHKDQELLTQDCLPRQNEEDLRSIHVVKAVLLNARHKPEGTVTGQDRKNAVKKVEEMEAEIESLKAKVAEQQNEINRKNGALDQYERKLLYMEALQYEFGTYRQRGREMEEDNRRMMLTNENLRAELDDLVKKHHDLKTTSEEIKLLVLQREVERAEKDDLFLTFEDLLKSAADLKQLIERAKTDPSAFVAMRPVQKKVYNLSAALHEWLCTIDVQEMEIKHLCADLYAKEKEIKKLRVVAQDVKLYEKDIMNLRYTNDELEYEKWSKNNYIIKLRDRIHELEGQIRSKDKEDQLKVLSQQGVKERVDQHDYEDKEHEHKDIKKPVCTQAQGYMQDTRPELPAAPTNAHTACKGTRGERR